MINNAEPSIYEQMTDTIRLISEASDSLVTILETNKYSNASKSEKITNIKVAANLGIILSLTKHMIEAKKERDILAMGKLFKTYFVKPVEPGGLIQ